MLDAIQLVNPAIQRWDASASGILPTTVTKGDAFEVVNAPADQSGRFGERMQNGDRVVWLGETFTTWAAEPHQWGVMTLHDVLRITLIELAFLANVQESALSDRNAVTRGEDYATGHGEIRLKIYATAGDYSSADLNTTGDVDEYTDPADQSGFLGIRLTGIRSAVLGDLPNLWVYSDDGSGNFERVANVGAISPTRGTLSRKATICPTPP